MLNKSFSYLLPLILSHDKIRYKPYIKNTFLFLEGLPTDSLIVALLLEDKETEDFYNFQEDLYNSRMFDFEFTTSKGQVIVFNLEEYKVDYEKFLRGKYSEFKTSSKDIIIKFFKNDLNLSKTDISDFEGIFYKKDAYRFKLEERLDVLIPVDAELSSIYNKKNETFIDNE